MGQGGGGGGQESRNPPTDPALPVCCSRLLDATICLQERTVCGFSRRHLFLSLFFLFFLHFLAPMGFFSLAATESRYPVLINYNVHAESFRVPVIH